MQERLYIVEGPSKSGKSTLLSELEKDENIKVIRGMPSQHPKENKFLVKKAYELIKGNRLNFRACLDLPPEEGMDLMTRCIRISKLQFSEAMRQTQGGYTIFLNRSIISLIALNRLASDIAIKRKNEKLASWSFRSSENAMCASQLAGVRGIIFITEPYNPALKDIKDGMSGLELSETNFLSQVIDELRRPSKIPLLNLNPNKMTIQEETQSVQHFIKTT